MKMRLIVPLLLGASIASCQSASPLKHSGTHWLATTQLCGSLAFAAPIQKTITTKEHKAESVAYENVLHGATLELFDAQESDEKCCGGKKPLMTMKSTKSGAFAFLGFRPGWYWLRVSGGDFTATISLHATSDFDAKACHDPSVGRIITVDSDPATLETRIY